MKSEAEKLAGIAKNVVVKLPLTMAGLEAANALYEKGVKTNLTLVFSPLQALLAAKARASYVSPFVGRLDDVGDEGMNLVEEIIAIYNNYAYQTEIIVASIRSPQHVLKAALLGADICTIPFKVINQLAQHPLTDKGLAAFLEDHAKAKAS
jgi:transaldolase